MKILLVEDEDTSIKLLTRTLKAHHYIVDAVKDGEMGWTYGSSFEYDLIIIDIVLPKLDGISLCRRLRTEGFEMPILLLTAQDSSTAKVQGLDAGADDYVVKPFDPAELAARIRALLRRGSANPFPLLTWGDLILNPSTCEVTYRGRSLGLTTKEYELLELMMRDSQHVFSTEELLDHLWSSEKFPSEATVRSHIRRVRHKLVAVGAPPDFIATMHGRGYYLKAPQDQEGEARSSASLQNLTPAETTPKRWEMSPNADAWASLGRSPSPAGNFELDFDPLDQACRPSPASQQQYLTFLNETWTTAKPTSLDQVALLLQAAERLQTDQLTAPHQQQAQQLAHKLAGTLSIFGLNQAVHLARQLEHWLGGADPLSAHQAPLLHRLVMALQADIQNTHQIPATQVPQGHSPLFLLVSADEAFNQSLQAIARSGGVQVEVVSPLDLDTTLTALDMAASEVGQPPDVLLLRLFPEDSARTQPKDGALPVPALLPHLRTCTQRYPHLPILVIGDRMDLGDRLQVARHGSDLLLESSTPPERIIAAAMRLLEQTKQVPKVMVVDDDPQWLQTLPILLKPWGFKVTTLAEPQQFWIVLEAVMPDVLVLDVNMPEINGFELCQILRSDPHWQRLPVLFLSVLTDPASQQQAFAVGADDYLCKPILGGELAHRILNRLQRVRAWRS
jgi:DNA-binding response OmpR family regulator/HPt (histidine-containing phosphotransfer) domain-containing protein